MGKPNLVPIPSPDDKLGIVRALQKLASLRLNADSTPTFAGLTIAGEMTVEGLLTEYVDFNLSPSVSAQEGRAYWNADDGTLNIGMPGGNVNLQVGQEILIRCRNTTGSLIVNGAAIRISGASGGKALIELADASDVNTGVTGLATEDIANNSNGYINIKGMVRDFDTSSFAPGTHLFLNSGGGLTNVPPTGNKRKAFVGTVIVQGSENGSVLIQPQNSPFLSGLSGVDMVSVTDGQVLSYDSATSSWKNTSPSTGVTTFSLLTDTPASMSGESLKAVRVNVGETALEYYTPDTGGETDHGALTGLADDDHVGYLLIDGTRAMTGELDMGANNIVSAGDVCPDEDALYDLGELALIPGGGFELQEESTSESTEYGILWTQWGMQTFTPTEDYLIGRVVLKLRENQAGEILLTVGIYATSGGKPTGSALVEKVVDLDGLGNVLTETAIDFDTPYALTNGVQYAIVMHTPAGGIWGAYGTPSTSPGGNWGGSFNQGASWSTNSGWDWYFQVYAAVSSEEYVRWNDLYLAGSLKDGTNELTIADLQLAYDHIHNLTTDIDHDALTNTHNLTTDVDHASITNTHEANIFKTVAVSGQSDVVADSDTDTLTFVAGTNVVLTTSPAGDSLTINSTGGAGVECYQSHGDLSAFDFTTSDFIADDTWRDLDLSSLAPDGAVAVILNVTVQSGVQDAAFHLKRKGNTNDYNVSTISTPIIYQPYSTTMVVEMDSQRKLQYKAGLTTWDSLDIAITGWLGGQLGQLATPIFIGEQATPDADIAGFGQLWVKNDTPNTLWFTDDGGTDIQLGVGGAPTPEPAIEHLDEGTAEWVLEATMSGTQTTIHAMVTMDGKLYGGTQLDGKLLEWTPDDTTWTEVADTLNSQDVIKSLCVLNGKVYGGTQPNGKLFEWNGTNAWVEVADQLNSQVKIRALTVANGKIYGGTGEGGRLFEWNGSNAWAEVAPQYSAEASIPSLITLNDEVYGGSQILGNLLKWNGTNAWTSVASYQDGCTNIRCLTVFNGKIYGGDQGTGKLVEWNGTDAWVTVADQYSTEDTILVLFVYRGELYAATQPNAMLLKWNGTDTWIEMAGRAGGDQDGIFGGVVLYDKIYGGSHDDGELYSWMPEDLTAVAVNEILTALENLGFIAS